MIPLSYYLVLSSLLFAIGLWGALTRTNAVRVLMGIEIMLNAVSLNFIAFNRYLFAGAYGAADAGTALAGQIFSVFVITIAAAEAAIGLAIILLIARRRGVIDVNQVNSMRG